jgi:hypothetical protein
MKNFNAFISGIEFFIKDKATFNVHTENISQYPQIHFKVPENKIKEFSDYFREFKQLGLKISENDTVIFIFTDEGREMDKYNTKKTEEQLPFFNEWKENQEKTLYTTFKFLNEVAVDLNHLDNIGLVVEKSRIVFLSNLEQTE